MVNYVDRGAIASNGVNGSRRSCTESGVCSDGSGIQGEFDLNNFRDSVISSAFMVGLLVASPIFASLDKSINPFRLIGVGFSVRTLVAAGCGLSVGSFDAGYGSSVMSRLVGPKKAREMWFLARFYTA
ncbi:hypothetical protein Hanom_Chr13g01224281 [Helianthus anomalus]